MNSFIKYKKRLILSLRLKMILTFMKYGPGSKCSYIQYLLIVLLAVKILGKIMFLAAKWIFLTDPSWEMQNIPHNLASSEEQIFLCITVSRAFRWVPLIKH